jgi:hypothetical protein
VEAVSRRAAVANSSDERCLKLLVISLFLPEGLSFFVGDFRLSADRLLIIVFTVMALTRMSRRAGNSVNVPSDVFAALAGIWMMLAATATDGLTGLKGAGIEAVEFTGAYFIFRYFLGPVDSSVRLVRFLCQIIVVVVGISLLDPLSNKLVTYEFVKSLTGYVKIPYETALAAQAESLFRDGFIRAMGPLEHSILLGAVCVWFGTLAFVTFPSKAWSWCVAGITLIGVWFSQARSPLLGYVIAIAFAALYWATPQFTARWKVVGTVVGFGFSLVFMFSGSPVATLVRLAGVSAESGWYRQAIWDTATPVVLASPLFGIGLTDNWNWQAHGGLVSASVDAFWLKAAMMYGIPGSILILLTLVGAFWRGAVDRSRYLSPEEARLSVALGLVTTTAVFLGFIVHYWGTCWILLAVFAGMRANLAEAAIVRSREARRIDAR